jgi:hypothetical protein
VTSRDINHEGRAVGAMTRSRAGREALRTRQAEETLHQKHTLLSNIQLTNQSMTVRLDLPSTTVRAMTLTSFLITAGSLTLLAKLKICKCLTDKDFKLKQQP